MSDYHEETMRTIAAKVGWAVAGAGGSATFAGLGAEEWAILASVATFIYVAIQILLSGPRLVAMVARLWRRVFGRRGDPSDTAGA